LTVRKSLAAAAAAAVVLACAHAPSARPPVPERPARSTEGPRQVGLASFYGRGFHGRRTASGVRYDARALTCAHPTAPFGTRLRVTELESGRSVVVTVTDRGPFANGRIVDLSLAAARRLGMTEQGVVRVRVEPAGDAE
jgi:peptidoglycan lytic transglycosylase